MNEAEKMNLRLRSEFVCLFAQLEIPCHKAGIILKPGACYEKD